MQLLENRTFFTLHEPFCSITRPLYATKTEGGGGDTRYAIKYAIL